jgi:hypothetical protein
MDKPLYLNQMKSQIAVLFLILLIGCTSKKEDKTGFVSNTPLEEIRLDSLGIEKIFADSSLMVINASEIKDLTQNLADTSLFAGLDDGFIRLDSIKKAGGYEDYLSKLDIGMYKDIRAIYYKKYDISASKSLNLWGFDYSSYEACPYANGKVIFVNTVENGKNVSCVPFAYFHNWADAPFYENFRTNSFLDKNGNVTINEIVNSGGVDEKDKEYRNTNSSKFQHTL